MLRVVAPPPAVILLSHAFAAAYIWVANYNGEDTARSRGQPNPS
jgi:hypothetical protein